jgi:hypothetical protein
MGMSTAALEWELESELEEEGEWAAAAVRCPHCARTFRRLATQGRTLPTVTQPRIAAVAARAALRGARDPYLPCRRAAREAELEWEVNPVDRIYQRALMEHMGHAATEAETEAEAEAFIGALVPLAARLIPRVAPTIMRAAPQLIRGVSSVARTLRANPATRPLVRALPTIVRRTTADVARRASRGQPVTTHWAVRDLARQTARVLGSPDETVRVLRRAQVADRRHHRAVCAPPPRSRMVR